MNRKECYEFIKAHKEMKDLFAKKGLNMTRMSTEVLNKAIDTYKEANAPNKSCAKNAEPCKSTKCTDEGARKAILAIAKILNLKNIERNFN